MFANTRAHHNIYLVSLVILVIKMVQICLHVQGCPPQKVQCTKAADPTYQNPSYFTGLPRGLRTIKENKNLD